MSKKKQKTIKTPDGHTADITRMWGDVSYSHPDLPGRAYDYLESIDRDLKKKKS